MNQVPNALSISRVFLAVPAVLLLRSDSPVAEAWVIVIVCAAALTDTLDGALARRLGAESQLGRVLDPVADKLAMGAMAVGVVLWRGFPVWAAVAVLARDFVILLAGVLLSRRLRRVPASSWSGKVYVTVLMLVVLVYVVRWDEAYTVFIVALAVAYVMSCVDYIRKAVRLSREEVVS
jgi:CDP-diacylglycerol--glycerol-3-phosphate 3-phosphatidyltransferase